MALQGVRAVDDLPVGQAREIDLADLTEIAAPSPGPDAEVNDIVELDIRMHNSRKAELHCTPTGFFSSAGLGWFEGRVPAQAVRSLMGTAAARHPAAMNRPRSWREFSSETDHASIRRVILRAIELGLEYTTDEDPNYPGGLAWADVLCSHEEERLLRISEMQA